MIRFEVTGETPEEFAENAMKAWAVLSVGLQTTLRVLASGEQMPPRETVAPPTEVKPTNGSESSSTASKADEVSEGVVDFAMEMDRRGGLIREKIEERKKVHSDKVDDLFTEKQPPASSAPSTSTTSAKSGQKTKGPKLDDLKTRLSEVIVAATARWDQKRANAYARKLLHEWRAPKLSDLAPDQYEIFMRVSESYLDGTAAE